jgi:hypothetical protein
LREAEHLEELAKETQDMALRRTLAEHFLEHPFETIERDLERVTAREQRRALRAAPALNNVNLLDVFAELDEMPIHKKALGAPARKRSHLVAGNTETRGFESLCFGPQMAACGEFWNSAPATRQSSP